MLTVNDEIQIPETEFSWKFARAGGPGGQNVNKVSSKAILVWTMNESPSVPADVKDRLSRLHRRYLTKDGVVQITSQKYRDQERNRLDCLDKLRAILLEAAAVPVPRKKTKPTRGSKRARLADKKHQSARKSARRLPSED